MKPIADLQEPFNDAHNYRNRAEKEFFNKVFLRTSALDDLLKSSVYFLMGEKGSGKTAYAVYMENNKYRDTISQVTTMTETQYNKFIQLKKQGHLNYSDYASIWRAILLFVISQMILTKSKGLFSSFTNKYKKVEQSLANWTANSLNPEIEIAFDVILREAAKASIQAPQVGKAEASQATERSERTTQIRHNLLNCEKDFREALESLKLSKNNILFFDGIDYRPESINYKEYLECIKGLGEAVWQLNSDFFGSIRDSHGRIKIVLLVRPDVFHALNLYNSNSRFQDNTVFLNWSTSEYEYHSSSLYEVSGRYFSSQQKSAIDPLAAWQHYYEGGKSESPIFKKLLRQTFQKPRDYLTFVKITRKRAIDAKCGHLNHFPSDCSSNPGFTKEFSDYLLGEARNYAAFYMTQDDFYKYIKFFQFLDGKREFGYDAFTEAFTRFRKWANGEKFDATEFLRDADSLLQLFFDMNVIGYYETSQDQKDRFIHWSYRERSLNNISPKVKADATLLLNAGIMKALDIGTALKDSAKSQNSRRKAHFKGPRSGRRRR
ncbi:P-loop ATPase, Sll1717 family [Pseudoxanthomonas wuyuanensis]